MSTNWCETCQEACYNHPIVCSVCGDTLTAPPVNATANPDESTRHDQLLHDMRQASRDLRNILGNLRGQVLDLDVLTRNILDEQDNLPQEVWDPQHGNSGPASRPTSKEALAKIPRLVLNEHSTLFRQATLRVNTEFDLSGVSSLSPAVVEAGDNFSAQQTMITEGIGIAPSSSEISSSNNFRKFDCTLGEFGSSEDHKFETGTSLVLASPITGKGGLDTETKTRISLLKASAKNVVLFMQRGSGLTFVQKAVMAQDAGAVAVIIGNNTSFPWPYVMKDSKGESKKPGRSLSIPVAMIKEEDGQEIKKMFEKKEEELKRQHQVPRPSVPKQIVIENDKLPPRSLQELMSQQNASSPRDDCYDNDNSKSSYDSSLSCELIIKAQSSDCPVCCEQLQTSETVVHLPGCGHVFHEECAMHWLKSHNTCPYCRRELPTDDPEYERQRRQRQQGNTENRNANGGSFYG